MTALAPRNWVLVPSVIIVSLAYGALVATLPLIAVGLLGSVLLLGLAFAAPVTHLALLLFGTGIVPFDILNAFGIGGGADSPGLIVTDLLLLGGILRAGLLLSAQRLSQRPLIIGALLAGFIAVVALQFMHGLLLGGSPGDVGAEARILFAIATFFVAVALLSDQKQRDRLLRALLVLGLLLGTWGIAQWLLKLDFSTTGDFGVREGVGLTTAGEGQLQGGLFGYPVATVIAFAALLSADTRSLAARLGLFAVVVLNATSLLLTFERTFWVATVLGLAFVAVRSGRAQRLKAVFAIFGTAVLVFVVFSTVAPGQLQTARERLLSVGQYGTDDSLRYRRVESRHVAEQIRERPIAGSGLAATIHWGRPWQQVPPRTVRYTHNGYLSLVWRLGLPGALLIFAVLVWSIISRPPPGETPRSLAVRNGCQAALLVLAVGNVTFPTFSGLSIMPVIGVLLALVATSTRSQPEDLTRPSAEATRSSVNPLAPV
ncbi:MAG: O-antigen ligase family protein [Solirubrobacteraceae bacterium]